jgi:uncharacterized peroxidase-related enzyme
VSRLSISTEQSAPEPSRPVLSQLKQALGMVPNVYAAIASSPGALVSLRAWSEALARSGLSKREIELISLHVSELNGCGYCVSAHSALGARLGVTAAELSAARTGTGTSPRENALLALARRVVRTGGARAGGELARLREAGVTDAEIIDVLAVVALNGFRNAVSVVGELEIDFPRADHLPSP